MDFQVGDKVRVYDRGVAIAFNEGIVKEIGVTGQGPMLFVELQALPGQGTNSSAEFHPKQCELIERPKKKVEMYQWLIQESNVSEGPWVSIYLFKDQKDLEHHYRNRKLKWVKRLDHTMIEVDDE